MLHLTFVHSRLKLMTLPGVAALISPRDGYHTLQAAEVAAAAVVAAATAAAVAATEVAATAVAVATTTPKAATDRHIPSSPMHAKHPKCAKMSLAVQFEPQA